MPMPITSGIRRTELPKSISDYLAGQPESGMGFQDVVCHMADGSQVDGIVINCQFIETVLPIDVQSIVKAQVKS